MKNENDWKLPDSLSLQLLSTTDAVNINISVPEWEGTAQAEVSSIAQSFVGTVTWWYQVKFYQQVLFQTRINDNFNLFPAFKIRLFILAQERFNSLFDCRLWSYGAQPRRVQMFFSHHFTNATGVRIGTATFIIITKIAMQDLTTQTYLGHLPQFLQTSLFATKATKSFDLLVPAALTQSSVCRRGLRVRAQGYGPTRRTAPPQCSATGPVSNHSSNGRS